jgi:hypothetical protein
MDTDRLYQTGGPGRIPIYVVANAHPAPISAGYGVRAVLDGFVKHDIPFRGPQTLADDVPKWAGNTHYWNEEDILDGTGTPMPQAMWDTKVLICQVLNDLMGWTSARHVGHGQHTRRKIDLRDGRWPNMAATIDALRTAMEEDVDYRTVKNVPDADWSRNVVDFGIDSGLINIDDDHPDDWDNTKYSDGRLWTFFSRYDAYLNSP